MRDAFCNFSWWTTPLKKRVLCQQSWSPEAKLTDLLVDRFMAFQHGLSNDPGWDFVVRGQLWGENKAETESWEEGVKERAKCQQEAVDLTKHFTLSCSEPSHVLIDDLSRIFIIPKFGIGQSNDQERLDWSTMGKHSWQALRSILSSHSGAMFTHEAHRLSHPLKPVQSIQTVTLPSPFFPHTHGEVNKTTPAVMSPSKVDQRETPQKVGSRFTQG